MSGKSALQGPSHRFDKGRQQRAHDQEKDQSGKLPDGIISPIHLSGDRESAAPGRKKSACAIKEERSDQNRGDVKKKRVLISYLSRSETKYEKYRDKHNRRAVSDCPSLRQRQKLDQPFHAYVTARTVCGFLAREVGQRSTQSRGLDREPEGQCRSPRRMLHPTPRSHSCGSKELAKQRVNCPRWISY